MLGELRRRVFHGRDISDLVAAWAAAIVLWILVFVLDRSIPALHEFLIPVYWIIAVLLLMYTAPSLRRRARDSRSSDRRKADRRKSR